MLYLLQHYFALIFSTSKKDKKKTFWDYQIARPKVEHNLNVVLSATYGSRDFGMGLAKI